ncbi:MAG: CoA transferase, partial [Pelagibacterales bacterium]|nr:CoA transferase [Pelagibacterales bacterium]
TGKGTAIQVSLFDGMADWMNVPYLQTVYGNRSVKRLGLSHPSIAPYGAYYAKCGKRILISIQNEREWVKLCISVLMLNDLYADSRFNEPTKRVKNRIELDKIISNEFVKYDKDLIVERLRKEKIACGVLNSIEDLEKHPQLRKIKCTIGDQEIDLIAPPSIVLGEENIISKVPRVGENSINIREEYNE